MLNLPDCVYSEIFYSHLYTDFLHRVVDHVYFDFGFEMMGPFLFDKGAPRGVDSEWSLPLGLVLVPLSGGSLLLDVAALSD